MTSLPVTALYTALMALMLLVLSGWVIAGRVRYKVGFGDGADVLMQRRIRAHGNFIEYAPLTLIALGIAEVSGWHAYWLHAIGLLLLSGRVLHAYGLARTERTSFGRFVGTNLNFFALSLGAVLLMLTALGRG